MENEKKKVYQIEGSSYDGCNGWSHWICDGIFATREAAENYLDNKLKCSYSRYKVLEVELAE